MGEHDRGLVLPISRPGTPGAGLPLHVALSNVGRPKTPTTQRRAPSSGGPSAGKEPWGEPASATPPPRPESGHGHGHQDAGSSSQGVAPGNSNSLTTVISSALDYKRFLDRRKQLIQQQVETAQAGVSRQLRATEGSDGALPAEITSSGGGAPLGAPVPGWTPGATGPVKASHAVVPAVGGSNGADYGSSNARYRRPTTPTSVSTGAGSDSTPTAAEETTPPASARSSQAAQNLLRRVCVLPERQRAQTAPNPTVDPASTDGEGRLSLASLPVGSARRACRSLGQAERETLKGEYEANGASNISEGLLDAMVGGAKQRDSSLDALLRDDNPRPSGAGTLCGSSLEDYIIGKQIGQGAYATVAFGLHKETSKKVAIKIYEKYKLLDPQRRKSVRCEIRLMERLRHTNIVVFHEALDTPKQIYLVMDFVGGGSLHHFLKKRPGRKLEDQLAKRLFSQVCQGVKYLHDRHIVHRDIKLENLLLDENGTVKIIDFGFSTVVPPGKKLKIFCGTPSYMSPEIVARKEYSGFCADIWAQGILLYALLCGSFPFRGQNDRDLYRKIVRGVFHIPEFVLDGARNLLCRVLTTDMTRRPSIEEVIADVWLSAHRDEHSVPTKGGAAGYHPNSSTSSTATTTGPSSSTGQSARENSGESLAHASGRTHMSTPVKHAGAAPMGAGTDSGDKSPWPMTERQTG